MPAALTRTRTPEVPAEVRETAALDAVALQALPPISPRRRTPTRLTGMAHSGPSSRFRTLKQSGALAARFFRAGDVVTVLALALLTTAPALSGHLGSAPLRDLLPIVVGGPIAAWLLGVFGLYGFGDTSVWACTCPR